MKIKTWFYNKKSDEARRYNLFIDYEAEDGMCLADRPEAVTVYGSKLDETEKAIYFWANTGNYGGGCGGFKMWIPKSVIVG